MKRRIFITIIILCSAFFLSFVYIDDRFVPDRGLQLVYESAILALVLGSISVTGSKYYADQSTDEVIKELKRLEFKIEQKIENLKSKFEHQQNSMKDDS